MDQPYLYVNDRFGTKSDWAIIVLPEIYGLHPFIKQFTDRMAERYQVPAVALDHLYAGSGKSKIYDYSTEAELGADAMQKVTGENFLALLRGSIDALQQRYPAVKHLTVCGFCFGGRLALLAGVDRRVNRIISYYGGGPHTPFYQGRGAVESLAAARQGDTTLQVLAFYGDHDPLIPATERKKTASLLVKSGIGYEEVVYDAGHAFANFEREHYDQKAAESAWQKLTKFID